MSRKLWSHEWLQYSSWISKEINIFFTQKWWVFSNIGCLLWLYFDGCLTYRNNELHNMAIGSSSNINFMDQLRSTTDWFWKGFLINITVHIQLQSCWHLVICDRQGLLKRMFCHFSTKSLIFSFDLFNIWINRWVNGIGINFFKIHF